MTQQDMQMHITLISYPISESEFWVWVTHNCYSWLTYNYLTWPNLHHSTSPYTISYHITPYHTSFPSPSFPLSSKKTNIQNTQDTSFFIDWLINYSHCPSFIKTRYNHQPSTNQLSTIKYHYIIKGQGQGPRPRPTPRLRVTFCGIDDDDDNNNNNKKDWFLESKR